MRNKILTKLTPTGKDWVTACLDPFHDNQLRLEGFPDEMSQGSIVMMHNVSYNISAPAGAAFDASVIFTGLQIDDGVLPAMVAQYNEIVPYDHAAFAANNFNSFTIRTAATGTALTMATHAASFPTCYENVPSRLIGVAFEVHNTTAEVYRQGSVHVAQLNPWLNDNTSTVYVDTNAAPYVTTSLQSASHMDFPTTVANVVKHPSSGSWDAKDGCYVIPRLYSNNIPVSGLVSNKAVCWQEGTTWYQASPVAGAALGAGTAPVIASGNVSGFLPVVAHFVGLSSQTTLRVTMRSIVEYFPGPTSTLLPMSTPSSPYDPKALQLYSLVAQKAPYARPVGDNASGDYFRRIMQIISQVASVVGPFTGPAAPIVAAGGSVAKAVADYIEKRQNQSSKKKAVDRKSAGASAMPVRR